jgi:tetratricopeptide (TPR) repeat protein
MSLERGLLLYEQSRYELAETELRNALAANPHDAYAHALLALCLMERKQAKDATEEARQAVHLAPDFPFAHYALAKVWYERDHYDEAQQAVEEAIRLDPSDPDYRFLLGAIHFDERRFQDALRLAEEGLALDPEHVGGNNLRALVLVKLGRTREAGATIDAALARDPQNSATHANRGWTLLEQGSATEAQEHFRESLRLDPDNEWARKGIVEALKARNPVYAGMLRYFLWMSRLDRRAQWGVIVGGYLVNRMLTRAANADPDVAPWVLPFRILYVAFVLLTWTADPLFNLVLRLNRFGRLALSREQIVESNWLGTVILLALLSLGACVVWGFDSPFLLSAMVFGFLIIPVAGTFKASLGWPRTAMWVYTGVLGALGLTSLAMAVAAWQSGQRGGGGGALFGFFLIGVVLAPWVANYLISRRPRR